MGAAGLGAALHRLAADRRLAADATGGCCSRCGAAGAGTGQQAGRHRLGWRTGRIAGCAGFSDDAAYRAMDFLLDALGEIAAAIFDSVAHLLNLDVDIVFVDSTSTYWEVDGADELADLQPEPEVDDGAAKPVEYGARRFGKSKDHRDDLPQVVIAMAVTRDGIPVRCWTFPGSESDQRIIRTVKDDLGSWNLHRLVWVADAGFASAANRAYLTRGGGHYIHAEKLRHTSVEASRRAGPPRPLPRRRRQPAGPGVRVAAGGGVRTGCARNGSWRATTPTPPSATSRPRRLIQHLGGLSPARVPAGSQARELAGP